MSNLFSKFKDKTVLVTGHTGFKGVWLCAWLRKIGANVVGIGLEPNTMPSHFNVANMGGSVSSHILDIRDRGLFIRAIEDIQPDFVFHLAAQAIVHQSYLDPVETWETNLMGTLNLLEGLRKLDRPCSAVVITSDKCYDNVEWVWGYRETDHLGGPDPYSASKGAAELVIRSHIKSYFPKNESKVRIASARAGNVIGGGDWSTSRIIPDCVRSWSEGGSVELRNPHATGPWQHVLEPLSGYLTLAAALSERPEIHGEPFNFGPNADQNHSVLELVQTMARYWESVAWRDVSNIVKGPYESGLLKLNCDKSLHILKWKAVMDFQDTVKMTADWYRTFYNLKDQNFDITSCQIDEYIEKAKKLNLVWAI